MKQLKRTGQAFFFSAAAGFVLLGGLLALNNPSPRQVLGEVAAAAGDNLDARILHESGLQAAIDDQAITLVASRLRRTNIGFGSIYVFPGEAGSVLAIGNRLIPIRF